MLDLGSGAGVDCFLASHRVGSTGTVIGVDMTPDMLHTARRNAKDRLLPPPPLLSDNNSVTTRHDNVWFRLGEIEHLPVADGTIDCVVSNCVLNLSPDKAQVVREIYRVLRPGGRVAVSDVVLRGGGGDVVVLPERLRTAQALAC